MSQKPPERRLRIRRKDMVKPGKAHINPNMAKMLQIETEIEVVLAGKRRFRFTAVIDESLPEREVWINSEDGRAYGIADNSIATVRRPLSKLI